MTCMALCGVYIGMHCNFIHCNSLVTWCHPLQVNDIYLPIKRNQAFIIKLYSKNRELFERVLGQEGRKKESR